MQIVLAKYLQVFCMTLYFSNNVNCEQMLLESEQEDKKMYSLAACTARCMMANSTLKISDCYSHCLEADDLENMNKIQINFNLTLFCRDDTNLVIKIKNKDGKDSINPLYILKVFESGKLPVRQSIYVTNTTFVKISNLRSNNKYSIYAAAVYSNNNFSVLANIFTASTMRKRYTPGEISNVTLQGFNSNASIARTINAVINWTPAKDMTCFYDILCYSPEGITFDLTQIEVRSVENLYKYVIKNLTFGTEYHIAVRGKNTKDLSRESNLLWHTIRTPTCLEWYKNNITICPPLAPVGLHSEEQYLYDNIFSINITWKKPDIEPDYYIIKLFDLDHMELVNPNSYEVNASKNASSIILSHVKLNGFEYEVHVTAVSKGGNSSTMISVPLISLLEVNDKAYTLRYLVGTIVIFFTLSILILIGLLIFKRRKRLKKYNEDDVQAREDEKRSPVESNYKYTSQDPPLDQLSTLTSDWNEKCCINDEMEIERSNIQLFEVIGEGAFGLVKRGILNDLNNKKREVAVKMLKALPSSDDIKEFRREIEVMKFVGEHPNIVSIVGHYTKEAKEMLLLTEYCGLGNLLDFLRSEWRQTQRYHRQSFVEKCSKVNVDSDGAISLSVFSEKNGKFVSKDIYEIPKICTSSCRCEVEIIPNQEQLAVKNCNCHPWLDKDVITNLAVENESYFKLLNETNLESNDDKLFYPKKENRSLTSSDLLLIAKQIALGMEFLSKNRVVHRDLAARNVLVCNDLSVKISDFGLSRDIYQQNIYKKTGNGKLPIKWLALESMTHQIYTSQSDVWSYGILLYEIVTLGGTPYPSIATSRLLKLLKTGYRMEKPSNCSEVLYNLMQSCWHVNPHERPTFTEIYHRIEKMILTSPEKHIIKLGTNSLIKNLESSYLHPL